MPSGRGEIIRAGVRPALFLLLLLAGANISPAGEPLPVDSPGIEADDTAAVGQLIRLRATDGVARKEGEPPLECAWSVDPDTPDFETYGDQAALSTRPGGPTRFAVHVAFILNGSPTIWKHVVVIGEGPPAPDTRITAAMALEWLERVPETVRNEPIEDPVTGEKYTRQQAVGRTFSDVGSAAKALGSIRATNVMLTTGLAAAFGSEAKHWEPFAEAADAALAAEEKRGVSPVEYGAILAVIGGALR